MLADPATSFSFAFASGGPTTAPAKSTDDPVAAANKTVDGMAAKNEMAILFPNVTGVSFGPLCCEEEDEDDDDDDELARDAWTVLLALPRLDFLPKPKNPDPPPERKGVADEDDIFSCSCKLSNFFVKEFCSFFFSKKETQKK